MESLLIYLLKGSALLGIFFLSYAFLLKRETTFQLNRKFLIFGLFTSIILPLIYFTKMVYIEANPVPFEFITTTTESTAVPIETPTDWWSIAAMIYFIITAFFILRLCLQLSSVFKIILNNKTHKHAGFNFLKVSNNQLPFSFFHYIVYNPSKHSQKDLDLILEHEKVHARQLHSVDIILVNLISCFFWFSPFAWLYKKAVEQNLEFIADRETVNNKAEIKEYQHALVKVSIADLRPALTNHFYQSFIKKRILMLNKKSSTQSPAWKLSLVMPLLLAFMLLFNVKTEAQIVPQEETEETTEQVEVTETIEVQEEIEEQKEIEIEENQEKHESIGIIAEEEPNEVYFLRVQKDKNREPETMIGADPLYVINNKEYKSSRLENKYIALNSGMDFIPASEAIKKYGSKGENGAIIIPNGTIIKNFDKKLKEAQELSNDFSGKFLSVGDNGKPAILEIKSSKNSNDAFIKPYSFRSKNVSGIKHIKATSNTSSPKSDYQIMDGSNANWNSDNRAVYEFRTINRDSSGSNVRVKRISQDSNKVYFQTQDAEPIYVVDDEIQTKEYIELIEPEEISSINVLKGGMAIREYGQKAKNGVIIIQTKEITGESNNSIFLIRNNLSSAEIDALKKEVKEKTDYTLELKDIERNSDGIITNISVKFYNSNSMVNSQYNNENGIPDVSVGLRPGGGLIISASE